MKQYSWLGFAALVFLSIFFSASTPGHHSPAALQLVWADEFNYTGLPDSNKWNYDTGGDGWGNHELQYYTSQRPENARGRKRLSHHRGPQGKMAKQQLYFSTPGYQRKSGVAIW